MKDGGPVTWPRRYQQNACLTCEQQVYGAPAQNYLERELKCCVTDHGEFSLC